MRQKDYDQAKTRKAASVTNRPRKCEDAVRLAEFGEVVATDVVALVPVDDDELEPEPLVVELPEPASEEVSEAVPVVLPVADSLLEPDTDVGSTEVPVLETAVVEGGSVETELIPVLGFAETCVVDGCGDCVLVLDTWPSGVDELEPDKVMDSGAVAVQYPMN